MVTQKPNPQVLIFWILWFSILSGLVILHQFLRPSPDPMPAGSLKYLPLLPLSMGVFVRWVLLPRVVDGAKALPLFIVGLALSEACGILGLILVPEMRTTYFLLALIGIFQYIPFFASRYGK